MVSKLLVDIDHATRLVRRWYEPSRRVLAVRQLNGGMINHVWAWQLDGEPGWLVGKLNVLDHHDAFEREFAALRWYREHSTFPVPEVHTCFADEEEGVSGLLMQRMAGRNLGEAQLGQRGIASLQGQLATHIASLHTHTAERFGPVVMDDAKRSRWLDVFGPTLEREFHAVGEHLSSKTRDVIHKLLGELEAWLPEQARPTLVHGDLWATNILVNDAHPDRPTLTAFVDPAGLYADPEYELAYLRLFHTAGDVFFRTYTQTHPLRPGFDRRCRIYWLNTMLLHLRLFGDQYASSCDGLARQIRQLA
ncbi:fructosamine kinase family protein [Phycisphaerales bacterium AB-hyl4]|uniref:Fructosamine kinase family protein n=1 Tax=Natronomicrosphaera hydrolytica TaxID=3242702 RepID=A0ABV4U892_9BACT